MTESVTDFDCSRQEQLFQFKNSTRKWPRAPKCSSATLVREDNVEHCADKRRRPPDRADSVSTGVDFASARVGAVCRSTSSCRSRVDFSDIARGQRHSPGPTSSEL